jgi:hypothetical protein
MKFSRFGSLEAILLLALAPTFQAHSWIQQLSLIASNGTFVGTPGYPRGFIQRGAPTFSDANLINLIPPNGRPTNEIFSTDLMCRESQLIGNQTEGYPALTAAPGNQIAMIYTENGHVTQLDLSPPKPVGSGTIYIYGTKEPANTDTYLGIHRVWNTDGTGGDQRGRLLATRHFDDGQCFQNDTAIVVPLEWERREEFHPLGTSLNCQSDVQVPSEAGTSGTYTLYWVWEWPTLDNVTGELVTNQSYTTCMDINMTSDQLPFAGDFNTSQVVDYRAIEAQLSTAYLVNPTISEQLTSTPGGAAGTTSLPATGFPTAVLSDQPSSAISTPTTAAGGFVTVTVTPSPIVIETMTVTETINNGAYQSTEPTQASTTATATAEPPAQPISTATVVPPQTPSSDSSTASSASSRQAVVPFLSPSSQVVDPPAQASTLITPASASASSAEPVASVAAASGCPDLTPNETSPTQPQTQSQSPAPSQTTVTYRAFKRRGRRYMHRIH